MSGLGIANNDFTAVPGVQVVASPSGAGVAEGARTNSALRLAESLSDLNPSLRGLAATVASEDQAVQAAAAKKAAIATGGKDLATAVREGKLTPTQNPYFIQDYNREATAVSSQADFDQLNVEASQWAEKNDPTAFRQKYMDAVNQISQKYANDRDSMEGFQSTGAPAIQNALAVNTAYNVQRITQERQENLSSLVSREIQTEMASRGGKPTGDQLSAAIEPLHQQWLSTGGDQAAWNKVALQGITAAAFNTGNSTVLDRAKEMSNGLNGADSGSLWDTLGAAEQLTTAKYRIFQEARDGIRLQIQARQEKVYEQGLAAQGALFEKFGPRLFSGRVSADEMTQAAQDLSGQFPAAAVAEAFKGAAQVSNSIRELNTDRESAYGSSAAGAQHISSLWNEATTRGWSPDFANEVGSLVFQGNLSQSSAQQMIDKAQATTQKMSRNNGLMGDNPAKVAKAAAKNIQMWTTAREAISSSLTNGFNAASRAGHPLSVQQQVDAQDTAITAASNYLETHPGDFTGAHKAALEAATRWSQGLH